MVAAVESSVADVEEDTKQLHSDIDTSQAALGQSIEKVDDTYKMLAAESATTVQSEISSVIEDSKAALDTVNDFFDQTKEQYQKVMEHISFASKLGTTKSARFEDVDNMLSQVPLIVKEYKI